MKFSLVDEVSQASPKIFLSFLHDPSGEYILVVPET